MPCPGPFVNGIRNSFPDPKERLLFLRKYYQLLLHGKFPQKEKKLCLVGKSDSGKTSWFGSFQGECFDSVLEFGLCASFSTVVLSAKTSKRN